MAEVGIGIRSKRSPHTLSITTYFCHSFFILDQTSQDAVLSAFHLLTDNIPNRNDVYLRN